MLKYYKTLINGKQYLYVYDTVFIDRGKQLKKNKSLGPADSPIHRARKLREFSETLVKEESKERVKYWQERISNPSFTKYVTLKKIEDLRAKLYRAKKEMGDVANQAMDTAFLVDFVYNSNRIEGSKVPRDRVEQIIRGDEKKKGDAEVVNTIKAIQFINNDFRFTQSSINRLHQTLLAHEPSKTGFRTDRVIVNESEVTPWKNIRKELKDLLAWYANAKNTWYPPELAFTFYYKFERIHPFEDGNGRVGRLIMNRVLKDHRYHPMIIWNKRAQSHMTAFRRHMQGKPEIFFKFMADQFIKTHEIYLEKIEPATNFEKQMEYFLRPSEYNSA